MEKVTITDNQENGAPVDSRSATEDELFCEVFWGDSLIAVAYKLPNGLYRTVTLSDNPVKRIFPKEFLNEMELRDILELRCWERDRADIDLILAKLGLDVYDPVKIVRKTNGISFNDPVWMKFPGDTLTYDYVKSVRNGTVHRKNR